MPVLLFEFYSLLQSGVLDKNDITRFDAADEGE